MSWQRLPHQMGVVECVGVDYELFQWLKESIISDSTRSCIRRRLPDAVQFAARQSCWALNKNVMS
jgi:hypothetical protein